MRQKRTNRRIFSVKAAVKDQVNAALDRAGEFGPNTFSVPAMNPSGKVTHYLCDIALTDRELSIMDTIVRNFDKQAKSEDVADEGTTDRLAAVEKKMGFATHRRIKDAVERKQDLEPVPEPKPEEDPGPKVET